MVKPVVLTLILLSVPAFGQNSITVTATRSSTPQADLALFVVDVLSGTDASRDDVLSTLSGSSITVANFSYLRTVQQYDSVNNQSVDLLDWGFATTAPLANFKNTIAQFTAVQQIVAQKKNGMSVSFGVQGTSVSPQAQQGQSCSSADLLADARTQAQKMAVAAGAGLGSVLAMSGSSASQPAGGALFSSPSYLPACSLTVKFALTGF